MKIKGKNIKVNAEDIDGIMACALEGGITFWRDEARVIGEYLGEYASDQISRGGQLLLHDMEEEETYLLNKEKFLKGLKIFLDNSEGKICKLDSGYEVDPANIDANDADCTHGKRELLWNYRKRHTTSNQFESNFAKKQKNTVRQRLLRQVFWLITSIR